MPDLTLSTSTRHLGEIVDLIHARDCDSRAFVLTPSDPIPSRRTVFDDSSRRHDDYSSARWAQEGPTFARIKRVESLGWLRRVTSGYSDPGLVHPMVGCAFYVRQWRYGKVRHLGMNGTGPLHATHERFDPIVVARLSDGRYFADQWADPSVLFDVLSRWRNARGYLCAWHGIGFDVTGAIGGLDWKTIPGHISEHRRRVIRERELADARSVA